MGGTRGPLKVEDKRRKLGNSQREKNATQRPVKRRKQAGDTWQCALAAMNTTTLTSEAIVARATALLDTRTSLQMGDFVAAVFAQDPSGESLAVGRVTGLQRQGTSVQSI